MGTEILHGRAFYSVDRHENEDKLCVLIASFIANSSSVKHYCTLHPALVAHCVMLRFFNILTVWCQTTDVNIIHRTVFGSTRNSWGETTINWGVSIAAYCVLAKGDDANGTQDILRCSYWFHMVIILLPHFDCGRSSLDLIHDFRHLIPITLHQLMHNLVVLRRPWKLSMSHCLRSSGTFMIVSFPSNNHISRPVISI